MSNLEQSEEVASPAGSFRSAQGLTLLQPREVPLGGPRAMMVRRTLPHREVRMIGAWCFVDHYGPVDLRQREGMRVPPHPHTGLQTVSWLVAGSIRHTDSLGSDVVIRPGELNLMTSGRGISHAEDSLEEGPELHGIQLWVALPDANRHQEPHFEHHGDLPEIELFEDQRRVGQATILMGEWMGAHSPAAIYSPIVGVEIALDEDATLSMPLNRTFEYGVLAIEGALWLDGELVSEHQLADLGSGRDSALLSTTGPARMLLLGGEPFSEQVVMWWNFIGRSHEEIVQMRERWQQHDPLFGEVKARSGRLDAPAMPGTRLKVRSAR